VGVGHSFGSLLLLMASYKRPELFEQVVLMDPPFLMGKKTALLEVAQKFKLSMVDRATPALLAVKRVDFWPSRDVAYQSLRHKSIFKRFDERCFQAYMAHGLVEDSARDGVTLRIPKALEAEIFRTVPSWWWRTPKSPPQVPVHLLTASDSIFYQHGFPQLIQQQYRIPYSVVEGGHMFPLETPEATAAIVLEIIVQQAPASADQVAGLA
jgi:pimeloyl-ACP methyl ester carboxylesterase